MAGITVAVANAMLNTELGGSCTLHLYSTAPTSTTTGTEITGSGYVAQSIGFTGAAGGVKTQAGEVDFPAATVVYANPVVAWAIIDSSGRQAFFRSFPAIGVGPGDQIKFPTGTIIITLA